MSSDVTTTVKTVTRIAGIAGQVAYRVTVQYEGADWSELSTCELVGSEVYGGPVVMVAPSGAQTFVTDPGRFGLFGREWVRRFFGGNDEEEE